MELFGLDVPPWLADLWNDIVTLKKTTGPTDYKAGRRRKAGRILRSRSARKIEKELRTAAEYIAAKLGYTKNSTRWKDFVFEETERLRDGILEPKYWAPCKVTADTYYASTGTNIENPNPRPYKYRNPALKPSTVTYSDGAAGTAPMATSGAISADLWRDNTWQWRRTEYELPEPGKKSALPPLLWKTDGTITAASSNRGSRPMFSLLMRAHIVTTPSPYDADLTAPVQPATSLYWRYPWPVTPPPYYNAQQARRALVILNNRATKDDAAELDRAIVKSALRPMLGSGFNNNTTVQTTYDGTAELWAVKPCVDSGGTLTFKNGGTRTVASIPSSTGGPYNPAIHDAEQYSIEGFYPNKVARRVKDGAVSPDPADALYLAGDVPPAMTLEITNGKPPYVFSGNKGTDRAKLNLTMDSLAFITPPDFANPTDYTADNIYQTCALALDAGGEVGFEDVALTVRYFYNVEVRYIPDTFTFYKDWGFPPDYTGYHDSFPVNSYAAGDALLLTTMNEWEARVDLYYAGRTPSPYWQIIPLPASDTPGTHSLIRNKGFKCYYNEAHPTWYQTQYPYRARAYTGITPGSPKTYTVTAINDPNDGWRYSKEVVGGWTIEKFTVITSTPITPT